LGVRSLPYPCSPC